MNNYSIVRDSKYDATDTAASQPTHEIDVNRLIELGDEFQVANVKIQEILPLLKFLNESTTESGNYIKLLKKYSYCPGLIDSNQNFIPLYALIEYLDGLIDYEKVIEEYPALSYTQINGAISFLRKIAQFNIRGVDIDQFFESVSEADEKFLSELRSALYNKEDIRVLNFD